MQENAFDLIGMLCCSSNGRGSIYKQNFVVSSVWQDPYQMIIKRMWDRRGLSSPMQEIYSRILFRVVNKVPTRQTY